MQLIKQLLIVKPTRHRSLRWTHRQLRHHLMHAIVNTLRSTRHSSAPKTFTTHTDQYQGWSSTWCSVLQTMRSKDVSSLPRACEEIEKKHNCMLPLCRCTLHVPDFQPYNSICLRRHNIVPK